MANQKNKVYYHVVMQGSCWVIKKSEHKEPIKVLYSINSYVERKRAEQNINDSNSKHYGVVKQFWGPKEEAKFKSARYGK